MATSSTVGEPIPAQSNPVTDIVNLLTESGVLEAHSFCSVEQTALDVMATLFNAEDQHESCVKGQLHFWIHGRDPLKLQQRILDTPVLHKEKITILSDEVSEWVNGAAAIRGQPQAHILILLTPSPGFLAQLARKAMGAGVMLLLDAAHWPQVCTMDALCASIFRAVPHQIRLKLRYVWLSGPVSRMDRKSSGASTALTCMAVDCDSAKRQYAHFWVQTELEMQHLVRVQLEFSEGARRQVLDITHALTGMGWQEAPWTSSAAQQKQITRVAAFTCRDTRLQEDTKDWLLNLLTTWQQQQCALGAEDTEAILLASWEDGCQGNTVLISNNKGVEDLKDIALRARYHLTPMVREARQVWSFGVPPEEWQDLITTAQRQGLSLSLRDRAKVTRPRANWLSATMADLQFLAPEEQDEWLFAVDRQPRDSLADITNWFAAHAPWRDLRIQIQPLVAERIQGKQPWPVWRMAIAGAKMFGPSPLELATSIDIGHPPTLLHDDRVLHFWTYEYRDPADSPVGEIPPRTTPAELQHAQWKWSAAAPRSAQSKSLTMAACSVVLLIWRPVVWSKQGAITGH